jgi:cytochrome c553
MKSVQAAIVSLSLSLGLIPAKAADETPPDWAFAIGSYATEETRKRPDDDVPRHVPGTDVVLTRKQTLNIFNVPDWHPDQHPPAPAIVMHGTPPDGNSCAYCHMPSGMGIPENASIAGLPYDYILQQFRDFRSGARGSVLPTMISYKGMAAEARTTSDEDMKAAARYFSSLKPKKWIKVVETNTVGKVRIAEYQVFVDPTQGTEPIGNRILEVPADPVLYDLHDDDAGFIAYVPVGSIAKGKKLALTGGDGKTMACVSCHGDDLRGTQLAPPIAGRFASNIVRQLYNIQHGKRNSPEVQPMQAVVADLTVEDMVNLAAYVTSRDP